MRSDRTPRAVKPGWTLLGPAFVAAIAYVDPGNIAANVSAGSRFGFLLVWVIVAANVMAGLIQYLSAKLGLVTGSTLPEAVRDRTRTSSRIAYWIQAELVAIATDVAEIIGGAIALQLLFGLPLILGGIITGVVSLLLLKIGDRSGQRVFERVITGMLLIITIGFLASLVVNPPPAADVIDGLIPRFDGVQSVLLATAMLGATVMPHAVYLHSSGLASTSVGAYAGSMIMAGLLRKSFPLLVRRLVTLIPALVVLASGVDPTKALVLSQVVLSFGIPFALVPLMRLTSDRSLMGADVNSRLITILGWSVAAVITLLNVALIYLTIT